MAIIIPRMGRRWGYAARGAEYGAFALDRIGDFQPSDFANLAAWYRADRGITLGTTPLTTGTAPPAATLSGTLNQSTGLYIQIDGAGTLGIATFKWSVNNGTTFVATGVLTAASVSLGTTGINALFPAGAYLTDNVYQATVATWADQSGNGRDLTQATPANQPVLFANQYNGRPALRFVAGSSTVLTRATTNLFGAGAYTLALATKINVGSAAAGLFGNYAAGAGTMLWEGTGTLRSIFHPGVAEMTDGAIQTTALEVWVAQRPAASVPTLLVNNVNQVLAGTSAVLNDPGGAAVLAVGAETSVAAFASADITDAVAYTRSISAGEATSLTAYLKTINGVP